MSRRSFSNCVIVVGVREPGATACQPRETTVQLRREPVEVIVSKLVDRDQDDERGRAGGAAICFGRELGAGLATAQYPEEQQKYFDRNSHGQIIPQ
jgi:hypothetical protein